jgi:uncharacterized membrane protein
MNYETKVEIEAPAERVWSVLADVERWPEWTASMREVTWLDGTTMEVGSRARVEQPGIPALVWEVSEVEPGSSFTWGASSPGISTFAAHQLKPIGPSRVEVTIGIRLSGPLAPIVGFLSGRRTKRFVQMEAAGLKARSESGT